MANLNPVYEHENESAPPIIGGLEQTRVRRESTSKMAATNGCHQKTRCNYFDDIPRPFFIGVAGGTASGKVSFLCIFRNFLITQFNFFDILF